MSKRNDRRALDKMLKRCGPEALIQAGLKGRANNNPPSHILSPLGNLGRPPQHPIEARIEELGRIYRKAAVNLERQGVPNAGPEIARGFISVGLSSWGEG